MNAFGWFEAKIRIYTDTKEALELLQLLEKRFQETEQKWAEENSEGDLFAGFHKDEQPDYTEYEMDSNEVVYVRIDKNRKIPISLEISCTRT